MSQSPRLASASRATSLTLLGAFALFAACVPILGIDQPTRPNNTECGTFVCADNSCGFQFKPVGTACEVPSGLVKVCDGAGTCKGDLGTECTSNDECLSASCSVGTCKLGLYSACSVNDECASNVCITTVCKSDDNAVCSTHEECASGLCFEDTCKRPLGSECSDPVQCASDACYDNLCKLQLGSPCATADECLTNLCFEGVCKTKDGNTCFSPIDCMSNGCTDNICRIGDGLACSIDWQCASGDCNALTCLKSEHETCSSSSECATGSCECTTAICDEKECTTKSCVNVAPSCGPSVSESCCASIAVEGGAFNRDNQMNSPATISDFRLDRFEVTVGRFRKFVEAYPLSRPIVDAGKHPTITGSGWRTIWDGNLPGNVNALKAAVTTCGGTSTWSNNPGASENLPINCVDWYLAFAFCAWDGGRLPTEAEWNFAASGGKQHRVYPWSEPANATDIDETYVVYDCGASGFDDGCVFADILAVGLKSPMGDGRWGHSDLAGNVYEWTFDAYKLMYTTPCIDCGETDVTLPYRTRRGGSWLHASGAAKTSVRRSEDPKLEDHVGGIRCARNL